MKDITFHDVVNKNDKGQLHGYQEGYCLNEISYRAIYKNNGHIGYSEYHGIQETYFDIK